MTTYSVDHKDGKVKFGISGDNFKNQFGVEQIHGNLTPEQASELARLLLEHADSARKNLPDTSDDTVDVS